MGKLGHLLDLGHYFAPWPPISVYFSYLKSLGCGLRLQDGTKPICHVNFDFKSDSGMYA